MSNSTITLLSTSGERRTPLGRLRRTVTYKSDNMDTSTLEAFGRFSLGQERRELGLKYQIEGYVVEGDTIRFTVSRESDVDVMKREQVQEAKFKALQNQVYEGLEHLVNNDPDMLAKMLAGGIVANKASIRFSNL